MNDIPKVFICSTQNDLDEERKTVKEVIKSLELNDISMEDFGARPYPPIDTCLKEVRKSDIVVLIVGHQYGSIVPGSIKSFTQVEYEEGYRLDIPCLVFFRDDKALISDDDRYEKDPQKIVRLKKFKGILNDQHTVAHFQGPSDISDLVSDGLNRVLEEKQSFNSKNIYDQQTILKLGVIDWNFWRIKNPKIVPNLKGLDLRKLDLKHYDFRYAILSDVKFNNANLLWANFFQADLRSGNFSFANLAYANFNGANLQGAIFKKTNLIAVNFNFSKLEDADLSGATLAETIFGAVDLSKVKGLDKCNHSSGSIIDIKTINISRNLPEIFLQGCGVSEPISENLPILVDAMDPIQFYSCFISYSTKDQEFAERLHADLQAKGVRCWFAPEDLKTGDEIRWRIDEGIRNYDKLLLILSQDSIKSDWVESEVQTSYEREKIKKETVLFPIRLDDAVFNETTGWSADIKITRNIGDFTQWKDHDSYTNAFDRLLKDLKAS